MKTLLSIFCFYFLLLLPGAALAGIPSTSGHLRTTYLSVSSTPVNLDSVPQGATRVRILPLRFRASCDGDVRLSYLRITHSGMGATEDIKGVYVMNADRRITRSAQFSSGDQTVLLRLQNVTIPACKTIVLDVAVDFVRTAMVGARHILSVQHAADIRSSADTIKGTFPVRSIKASSSITPEPVGEVQVEFLPIGGINAVRNELLAKIAIKSVGTHHLLYGITLTNTGTADRLRNLYLTSNRGGALTPVVPELDKGKVTLRFKGRPFFLRKGKSIVFQLRGQAYTYSRTVNFILEEPSDLEAIPTRRRVR